jgi:hypothetical protein
VGVAISLYDNATRIDRSAPDAVVDRFIRAYLVDRDDQQAAFLACADDPDFASLDALRSEFLQRERDFGVQVVVNWGSLTVTGTGEERRSVSTELNIAGTMNGQVQSSRFETWTFGVVQDDGWRVCSASKTA